ncbi:hypothetical protein A2685_03215 [Candidatus Woesebacteria bacterium RIFCSPHIGHO2_01_FULL_37_10]|uniref:Aminoglycoside phosphotransferase domain-containing protein n=1 Tax=Candidatus Woesebacteria bacterium RIFCSPHIGHO2_01_FULL_37_10 TaxID=1802489 RepID=A0A1F7XSW9_9BACT|nr:MAG: hypothetical protein A2685_03215 [Candidatus Woesebacteria bacterium RIFCSPHIGHO2_01_FULL_37_10]
MSIEWGKVNHQLDIENGLAQQVSIEGTSFSFTHIKSGFTDNVFLINASSSAADQLGTFIAKEYLEEWHQKEQKVYEDILQHHPFLGAPALITSGDGFVILEHFKPEEFSTFSAEHIGSLQSWVIQKHIFFSAHPQLTEPFKEEESVQIKYLVEKPFRVMRRFEGEELTTLTQKVLGMEDYFADIVRLNNTLPATLEHGDLEPQNLFVGQDNGLKVVDWVNTRRGSGLFDINQFFETARDLGVALGVEQITAHIAEAIGQGDLGTLLPKIRMIMLLNKIHFYGDKHLSGETFSHSRLRPVYEMLIEYLSELNQLIEQTNN